MVLVKKARKIPFVVVRATLVAFGFKPGKFFPKDSILTQQLFLLA